MWSRGFPAAALSLSDEEQLQRHLAAAKVLRIYTESGPHSYSEFSLGPSQFLLLYEKLFLKKKSLNCISNTSLSHTTLDNSTRQTCHWLHTYERKEGSIEQEQLQN